MTKTEIQQTIKDEMLTVLQEDPDIQHSIIQLTRYEFADKRQTDDRFEQLLEELRRDRIEQNRKWDEQNQKWDKHNQKWDEQNQKWDKHNQKWDEQNQKWERNQQVIDELLQEVKTLSRKHDSTIGALGARWGLHTEASFRNALKSILEESFDVEVLNINEFDEKGDVFGRPNQVELDVIIQNGIVIICEIKSSISRGEVHLFDRKVTFYEKLHQRKATRKIIISPMMDERAKRLADKLEIEVYSYAEDVRIG